MSIFSAAIDFSRALISARSGEPGAYVRFGSLIGAGMRRTPLNVASGRPSPVSGADTGLDAGAGSIVVFVDISYLDECESSLLDDCRSAHVGAQRRRNHDGSVLLLVVLHDRDDGAADREPRTVQGVDELRLPRPLGPIADVRPSRLEGFRVAARRDLAIRFLTRQPDFDV